MKGVGMFFFGDLAVNSEISISYDFDASEYKILNCEGYLVDKVTEPTFSSGVFNNVESIVNAFGHERLLLSLANNHVMDKIDGVTKSIEIAKKNKLSFVGADINLNMSLVPKVIIEQETEVAIISAGWDLIGCKHATEENEGVAPLLMKYLVPVIKKQVALGRKVALFLHWGYETEKYPLPLHREMAFKFIDLGVDIIIGCHAHCLQGHEKYKGKSIFYGIGNSAFQQNYYYDGKLSFPDYCERGLVVRWEPKENIVTCCLSRFDDGNLCLSDFKDPTGIPDLTVLSGFSTMNHKDYIEYFKRFRVKKKLLPVFIEHDGSLMYKIKFFYTAFRGVLISSLFKVKSSLKRGKV